MKLAKTIVDYVAIGTSSNEFNRNEATWATARTNKAGVLSKLSKLCVKPVQIIYEL